MDKFRIFRYDLYQNFSKGDGIDDKSLLQRRHNIYPGIFLIYRRGELLWAGRLFNGYSTSVMDLRKQLNDCERDQDIKRLAIPPDYKFSDRLPEHVSNMQRTQFKKPKGLKWGLDTSEKKKPPPKSAFEMCISLRS
jgi:hypothetical protein